MHPLLVDAVNLEMRSESNIRFVGRQERRGCLGLKALSLRNGFPSQPPPNKLGTLPISGARWSRSCPEPVNSGAGYSSGFKWGHMGPGPNLYVSELLYR